VREALSRFIPGPMVRTEAWSRSKVLKDTPPLSSGSGSG
jgi:hypothetical protein